MDGLSASGAAICIAFPTAGSSSSVSKRWIVHSGVAAKKIEMLFAHLKRIIGLRRLRLRGPTGAKDEFLLAATAQNLRKLAKLIVPAMPERLAAV